MNCIFRWKCKVESLRIKRCSLKLHSVLESFGEANLLREIVKRKASDEICQADIAVAYHKYATGGHSTKPLQVTIGVSNVKRMNEPDIQSSSTCFKKDEEDKKMKHWLRSAMVLRWYSGVEDAASMLSTVSFSQVSFIGGRLKLAKWNERFSLGPS